MNDRLIQDMNYWWRRIEPCGASGIRLMPEECYRLAHVLSCAHDSLLQVTTDLEIERSRNNALDPEGSRRRMELQRTNGASPYEERHYEHGRWVSTSGDETRKPPVS